jgi:hypothetical protein
MFFELLRDGLILMRTSARTRVNFVPGRHPAGPLRSSVKPAQKEFGIFDPSNTFLLYPVLPAVLSGVQSQWVCFSVKL